MAGYLYQVRYALLRALEEARSNPGRMLLIEKFDDVAFSEDGRPVELIQTKHHLSKGDVSDRSLDLWRTLAVWMDRLKDDPTGCGQHASCVGDDQYRIGRFGPVHAEEDKRGS